MAGDNILRTLTRKNYITGTYYPSEGRHSVYICCAPDKTEVAEQLADYILRMYDCIAIFKSYNRSVRNTLSSRIENAISSADAVILAVTPRFSSCNDVVAELNAAKRKNVPIVPVFSAGTEMDVRDAEDFSGRRIRCIPMGEENFADSLRENLSYFITDYSQVPVYTQFYKVKSTAPVESFTAADKLQYSKGYINGVGTQRNHEKAIRMLSVVISSTAESDPEVHKEALWQRGHVYWLDGNHKLAAADWHEAATKEYAEGYHSLGCLYYYGEGTQKSIPKAAEFFRRGANAGCGKSYYMLGNCYLEGIGCEQNSEKAEQCFLRGAGAGYADNYKMLALMNKDKDLFAATNYYESACRLHEPDSCEYFELASLYAQNETWEKAIHFYECAAQLGSKQACLQLGDMFESGKGVEEDAEKANNYFRMAGLVKPSLNSQAAISSLTTAFKPEEETPAQDFSDLYKFANSTPAEDRKLDPDAVVGHSETWDADPEAHAADMENSIDYTYFDFDPNQKNSPWEDSVELDLQAKAHGENAPSSGPSLNMATESGLEDMTATLKRRKIRRIIKRTLTGVTIGALIAAILVLLYLILNYYGIL